MGGCFQTGWSRKAKKRRLLLTMDLRLLQLGVGDYEQVGYHRSAEQLYRCPTPFTCMKFMSLLRGSVVALMQGFS